MDNKFITTSSDGTYYESNDGLSWTQQSIGISDADVYDIAHGNGVYVGVGPNTSRIVYKEESSSKWNNATLHDSSYNDSLGFTEVVYNNGFFVAMCKSTTYYVNNHINVIGVSSDGKTWTVYDERTAYGYYTLVAGSGAVLRIAKWRDRYETQSNIVHYTTDGLLWLDKKPGIAVDIDGNDGTGHVLEVLKGISTDVLNVAYKQGVNSYAG